MVAGTPCAHCLCSSSEHVALSLHSQNPTLFVCRIRQTDSGRHHDQALACDHLYYTAYIIIINDLKCWAASCYCYSWCNTLPPALCSLIKHAFWASSEIYLASLRNVFFISHFQIHHRWKFSQYRNPKWGEKLKSCQAWILKQTNNPQNVGQCTGVSDKEE